MAAEWHSAFACYAGLFGRIEADAVDMVTTGLYRLVALVGPRD